MIPTIGINATPVLLDRVFAEINAKLTSELPWLNEAFGRAYSVEKNLDGIIYKQPAIYVNNREYLSVLPCDNFGNFSFFLVDDPQTFEGNIRLAKGKLKANVSIIFWFSLSTIFVDGSIIDSEQVKYDILKVLTFPALLTKGRFTVTTIHEKAENIYRSFSIKLADRQHTMFPYYGFKFNGDLIINELC